jgi:hypothetical protein
MLYVFWKPRMGSSLPRDGLHVEGDVGVGEDDWRAVLVGKKWSLSEKRIGDRTMVK